MKYESLASDVQQCRREFTSGSESRVLIVSMILSRMRLERTDSFFVYPKKHMIPRGRYDRAAITVLWTTCLFNLIFEACKYVHHMQLRFDSTTTVSFTATRNKKSPVPIPIGLKHHVPHL